MRKFDRFVIALAFVVALSGAFVLWTSCEKTSDPELNEFSTWALGDDWGSIHTRDIPARWNERHGDLFTLHIDDDLGEGNNRMYEAWRKHKLK